MATTGTNYTAKWKLIDGTLTISPISGNSGEMRGPWTFIMTSPYIKKVIDMTDEEWLSVVRIVFEGNISIKESDFDGTAYIPRASSMFSQWNALTGDVTLSNVVYIDIRGLNTTGCTSFSSMFARLSSLTEIVGLDTLVTSSSDDYSSMFLGTDISELNLSSFENMNTANIKDMIDGMNYLATVVFPINFSRTSPKKNNTETEYYSFGIAKWNVQAVNSQAQITITSDEDFFSLESGQGGTWTRDISGSATLLFRVNAVQRDGNNVTVSYFFTTSTATAYVYLKESSASSFPQSPTETISLTGSGNGTLNLTLATDSSYELQFIVSDGVTNLYVFASVDSNVLLIEVDNNGNVRAAGDIEDGYGNKLSEMIDLFYPVGSYYETSKSQAEFDPNDVWGGTWELETAGQVHVSSGSGYAVSGAETNTSDGGSKYLQAHTHSDNFTLPNHLHSTGGTASEGTDRFLTAGSGDGWGVGRRTIKNGTGTSLAGNFYNEDHPITRKAYTGNPCSNPSIAGSVGAVSGATTGNAGNMPPYIVVNRWHRTA